MTAKVFVDTNILVYALDCDSGWKHEICNQLVKQLWEEGNAVISTQVMQEFYVNVTQKLSKPLTLATAREALDDYAEWEVVQIEPPLIFSASELQERYRLSFWDSLILAAAQKAGVEMLLTEDLNHGQVVGGVRIHNPLLNQVQEEVANYTV
jgi:predicted nucleic acid-binding protein